jgi:hypothetical protein
MDPHTHVAPDSKTAQKTNKKQINRFFAAFKTVSTFLYSFKHIAVNHVPYSEGKNAKYLKTKSKEKYMRT